MLKQKDKVRYWVVFFKKLLVSINSEELVCTKLQQISASPKYNGTQKNLYSLVAFYAKQLSNSLNTKETKKFQ